MKNILYFYSKCVFYQLYIPRSFILLSLKSLTSQLVNTTGIPYVCAAFCNSVISMKDLMMTT